MNLSISNIAWGPEQDQAMYTALRDRGFQGLEGAPTRFFPERPYDRLEEAAALAGRLKEEFGLCVPSLQSIWFGRSENLFASPAERAALLDYTRRAMDFAAALDCGNLVFGCPRNRATHGREDRAAAVKFFRALGQYALEKGTVLAMEANPPLYNTDFVNTTAQAFALAEEVACPGFRVNLDVGTMVENGEGVDSLAGHVGQINHVHISEPNLLPIQRRSLHAELAALLREEGYTGFVSIEMKNCGELASVLDAMDYAKELFA